MIVLSMALFLFISGALSLFYSVFMSLFLITYSISICCSSSWFLSVLTGFAIFHWEIRWPEINRGSTHTHTHLHKYTQRLTCWELSREISFIHDPYTSTPLVWLLITIVDGSITLSDRSLNVLCKSLRPWPIVLLTCEFFVLNVLYYLHIHLVMISTSLCNCNLEIPGVKDKRERGSKEWRIN